MLLTDVSRDVKNIQKLLNSNFPNESQSSNSSEKADEHQQRKQQLEGGWDEGRLIDAGAEVRESLNAVLE